MGSSIGYVHSWTQGRVYVRIGSIVFTTWPGGLLPLEGGSYMQVYVRSRIIIDTGGQGDKVFSYGMWHNMLDLGVEGGLHIKCHCRKVCGYSAYMKLVC